MRSSLWNGREWWKETEEEGWAGGRRERDRERQAEKHNLTGTSSPALPLCPGTSPGTPAGLALSLSLSLIESSAAHHPL